MLDIQKRQSFETVGELRALLEHLPATVPISVCGSGSGFCHENVDGSGVCLDYSDLDNHYKEQ